MEFLQTSDVASSVKPAIPSSGRCRRSVSDAPSGAILLLSFHFRRSAMGGGNIVSQHFRAMLHAAATGPVYEKFHDDPVGTLALRDGVLKTRRRRRVEMFWRLVALGALARFKFDLLNDGRCDGLGNTDLVIDGVGLASVLCNLRCRFRRVVVLFHNFEADYYSDAYFGSAWRRWYVRAGTRAQRIAAHHASIGLFLTESDLRRTRADCGSIAGRAEVLGVFEPVAALRRPTVALSGPLRVLVTGELHTRKGMFGLIEIIQAAQQRRQELKGKVRFVIAGRNPPAVLVKLADNELVQVVANPTSIASIAASCDLYLNPNFTGSGIKVRNLDGLRNGLKVLCRRENSAGFSHLPSEMFTTFATSHEGLDLISRVRPEEVRGDGGREAVWREYAYQFSLARGAAKLRSILADN